jgi:alkylation response protein AidB-like acyl-CoA dehydrogenase
MDFSLSTDQETFLKSVASFAAERVAADAAAIDATNVFPRELVVEAAREGLLAVTLPREWGGAGRDYVSYVLAVEEVARHSAVLAVILTVCNSLVAEFLFECGDEAQRKQWLKRLASGEALGAFALSEPQSGSDAAHPKTAARQDGHGYVINGRKVWVANAEVAEFVLVFAATDADAGATGVTAFLVPMDAPGITRESSDSLGVRGLGCQDLTFNDVRVPAGAVVGGLGRGFAAAMRALEGGRAAIAAQALGVGQAALDEAVRYAQERRAFGQPIGEFQAIQFQLADLATDLEAARMLTWKAADARSRPGRVDAEAAMAKLMASEAAHRAADRAMQILASAGYRRGSTIERLFRDVRAAEIYQGTSEVQRMIIAKAVVSV